jgi:hypothetical protein
VEGERDAAAAASLAQMLVDSDQTAAAIHQADLETRRIQAEIARLRAVLARRGR